MRWEDCVKRDLERVGGEQQQDTKSWTGNREGSERKEKMTVTMASLTPDDRDNKRIITMDLPLPASLLLGLSNYSPF